jgi:hypothetical protein
MSETKSTRRTLLTRAVFFGAAASAPMTLLSACGGGELSCNDGSELSTAERDARRNAAYAERATDPARACSGCMFFQAAGAEACGSCSVVRGPIHPRGSCNLFAPRP